MHATPFSHAACSRIYGFSGSNGVQHDLGGPPASLAPFPRNSDHFIMTWAGGSTRAPPRRIAPLPAEALREPIPLLQLQPPSHISALAQISHLRPPSGVRPYCSFQSSFRWIIEFNTSRREGRGSSLSPRQNSISRRSARYSISSTTLGTGT